RRADINAVEIRIPFAALAVAESGKPQQCGRQIHPASQRGRLTAAVNIRMSHDERHTDGFLINVRTFADVASMRAGPLPVIRRRNHDSVALEAEPLNRSEQ